MSGRLIVRWALPALCLLLAGCMSTQVRTPVPVDALQAQAQDARRGDLAEWAFSGRVAISKGRQGGSGRIEWRQQAGQYAISLAAPVTRQSWRLTGDAAGAQLEGIEGGPRADANVEALLMDATGWEIPVRAMVDWVRGVAAPERDYGPVQIVHGAGDLPAGLEQAGWSITYREWHPAEGSLPALPRRIEAVRDDARVRLVVDGWSLAQSQTGG